MNGGWIEDREWPVLDADIGNGDKKIRAGETRVSSVITLIVA
jgi:hypothetical protein